MFLILHLPPHPLRGGEGLSPLGGGVDVSHSWFFVYDMGWHQFCRASWMIVSCSGVPLKRYRRCLDQLELISVQNSSFQCVYGSTPDCATVRIAAATVFDSRPVGPG